MSPLVIVSIILVFYLWFAVANLNILLTFHGFDNSPIKQQYAQEVWLYDRLYDVNESISKNKYCNILKIPFAILVIFCPVFNIVWMIVTLYKLKKFHNNLNF